ncbi:alginate O-acetyltransferase AlgX-related protein [Pseudomonas fitomaticsae]|uniref:AlgX/AlgJ SGNH hydrolase-like domain-containing protein n=1 Tax=Pseudomonas fitomaticsae TaxID=2837969 RepID=A0ABY3PZI5_9PSED|nr:hypothetical protein [Pseudomonas fitomaticsae]UFP99228.1 hypothetical protein KJY40_24860 [Pseudomonas fitomaticsae]
MKRRLYAALTLTALIMCTVPTVNLYRVFTTQSDVKWWKAKVLYNMDLFHGLISQLIYPMGLSIHPSKVIIGKEGWLFLGDEYADKISVKRAGVDKKETQIIENVARSVELWDQWLSSKGVTAFRIVIGPDKDSVYPEYLPDWSSHTSLRPTDVLLRHARGDIYVDPIKALVQAKQQFAHPLYYRTDTHWNNAGAWIAFDELRKSLTNTQTRLIWPQARAPLTLTTHKRGGGDLAHFLRIQESLSDNEVVLNFPDEYSLPVEHHDFNSGEMTFSGQNIGIASPASLLLVSSPQALNSKKVLWLRDSFGTAMTPLMTATFSETLHVYYLLLKPEALVALVERFQPDYVFITSVERDIRGDFFQSGPPVTHVDATVIN